MGIWKHISIKLGISKPKKHKQEGFTGAKGGDFISAPQKTITNPAPYVASLSQLPSSFYQPAQKLPKLPKTAQPNYCQFDIISATSNPIKVPPHPVSNAFKTTLQDWIFTRKTSSRLICTELPMITRFYQITNNLLCLGSKLPTIS